MGNQAAKAVAKHKAGNMMDNVNQKMAYVPKQEDPITKKERKKRHKARAKEYEKKKAAREQTKSAMAEKWAANIQSQK
eukprot:CAMPEP_0113597406 /NCGR_PEP_ID=MMETSP0015_2-20120614/40986_1 /TAXON_ID=2838 /ORGANISM="Odontella" /LENGTH=77 /DNA_ID=CAMNT_0000505253 /DNA_START=134 /DNA_END=367 /DNA_ORIENTATION=- /assembly_acc=CAM_ASM_000160